MRSVTPGICLAVLCAFLALPASAEPIQQNQNGPLFVNDHDGGIMPNQNGDPDFVIDPDGQTASVSDQQDQAGQDQDEDGDISMYQGQDDTVPA